MKKKYLIVFICIISVSLLIGFACSKKSSSNSNPSGGNNAPAEISMYNMTFSPASKSVKLGTIVKWTNNDGYTHTVTSNDGTTFNSGDISGGGTYSYTTTTTGTFDYHCTIHGLAMSGTLTVTP